MKKFYGSIFIEKKRLEEAGILNPIKLEYYKIINEDEIEDESKYGIEIVKTEYFTNDVKIERKAMGNLTNDKHTYKKY